MAAFTRKIPAAKLPHYWYLYFLALPSLLMVALFAYFPAASAVFHSFFRWNGDYVNEFVGLANFLEALRDPVLGYGFVFVTVLILANVVKMIPSVITAVVINRLRNQQAGYVYKVLFVVPMIIPSMVYLLMWKFFYDPSVGIFNRILNASGILPLLCRLDGAFHWNVFHAGMNPVWLGDVNLIVPALIFWGFPWVSVFGVLVYLAGLQSIDESVYEAAAIDGVGPVKKFLHIELPLIMSQVRINLFFVIIGTLQDYGTMYVLYGLSGGPDGKAMVPGLWMFAAAFQNDRAGYGCAIGLIMFAIILALTQFANRFVRVEK